tara:strand:- start:447 stop:1541 length:1095 start_codon:yes stop_codon:yes gene_type:complete
MATEEILEDGESDKELEDKIMEAAKELAKKKLKKEEDDEKKDDEEEVKEGELPPALKKAMDKKKGKDDDDEDDEEEKEESKKKTKKEDKKVTKKAVKKEEDDEEEDEEEEPEESKKAKKEEKEIEVDVSADVEALVDGEELSEDFKTKAATIFEAAVKSKISKIRKQIREESKKEQDERIESMQTEMTENMDNYLNYAVKEWMTENKLAVEQGVRNEVTESFISGLKKLFEEHYIDVPQEKEDIFENLVVEVAELEEKLDEQTEKHMDTVKELNIYKAKDIFKTVSDGMTDTDKEKFSELTEDVDYDTDDQYREKLNVIKNSYFKSDQKDVTDNKKTAGTNNPVADGKGDSYMDGIVSAISKTV